MEFHDFFLSRLYPFSNPKAKKSISSHLCTVADFAIEMFDVLDAINYQSYNDFVLRVGEYKRTSTRAHVWTMPTCHRLMHTLRVRLLSDRKRITARAFGQETRHVEPCGSGVYCLEYPVGNL